MPVRTVFFDFGGTLAEPISDPSDVWVEVAQTLRVEKGRDEVQQALRRADEWFHTAVFAYHGRTPELWRGYDRLVLRHLGIDNPDERQIAVVQERFARVQWTRPYPESRATLEVLRTRGYGLGVVSNATDEVMERLGEFDLKDYFDSVTYSQEAGANKPDPRIFLLALDRAGCVAAEAVHVGNRYEDDVVGARSVGIAPVLVDRDNTAPDADCPRVRDLQGVLDLLP